MQIEVRVLDNRILDWGFPYYGSDLAAGMDLFACLDSELKLMPQSAPILVPTGVSIHIADPEWCGVVVPRSGLAHQQGLILGNSVGVIDADYTGQCFVSAWNRNQPRSVEASDTNITIKPGDRIAQILIVRVVRPSWRVVDHFSAQSSRGTAGFGSTNM